MRLVGVLFWCCRWQKRMFTLPLGDRRFWREKACARLRMQGKVELLRVIPSSHARLADYFTGSYEEDFDTGQLCCYAFIARLSSDC